METAAVSPMRIYNTRKRSLEDFEPTEPGHVRLYVCGMTVYDYCHIGHARAMLTFDMVYRWLKARGWRVTYVRNHTDVDDKIIARAIENGEEPLALAQRFIAALDEDLCRLGLLPPDVAPLVSDNIEGIVAMASTLIERGHAYAVDGDVYFAVESFERYGELSGRKLDDLRAGERVNVDERKRHPGDFALWKSAKPGEVSWPSPWGPGRPGWHIECSVMATRHLGETFDIHGGGIDLVFPHHENEIAQSECASGVHPFARVWMHNGHLNMAGTKMSKSLGNIIRIRDILDEVPAETLRLLYLESHYRSPLPYSAERLRECLVALDRVYSAKEVLEEIAAFPIGADAEQLVKELGETAEDLHQRTMVFAKRFAEAMDDDFATGRAIALLHELARSANRFANNRKWRKRSAALAVPALKAIERCGKVLGIGALTSADWFDQVKVRRLRAVGRDASEIESRIEARLAARANKDWAEADRVRVELDELGIVLMDGPQGTTWRMRLTDDA